MKILRRAACLLFATLTIGSAAEATPPINKGQRVLSCGHSFHFHVPAMLEEVAKSAGFADHAIAGKSLIGGSKSIKHWELPDPNPAKQALASGKVDVMTLTPIYLPDEGVEKLTAFGLQHEPDLRVTVQEFWLPFDEYQPAYYNEPRIPHPKAVNHNAATGEKLRDIHTRYFNEMDAFITGLNAKFGKPVISVVPVGQAVIALREKIIAGETPGLQSQEDLFTDPLGHPKESLQVLIVYCHYAVIYRKNPIGLPVPKALSKMPAEDAAALNKLLQQIAWDAVTSHPLSGVTKP